jgi:hypothetical protein
MKPDGGTPASMTERRLREAGLDLWEALLPIVTKFGGSLPRQSRLTRNLKLDKSLASRLSRAFKAERPLEFMHSIPSPAGLRILLKAALRAGLDPDVSTRAERSVTRFQALIDDTPGGLATLTATIAASSPEARKRSERSAKQAVFRAMSYLLGFQCESAATAFIIRPAGNGKMADGIDVNHKTGIRRLRPTAPVGLFGHRLRSPGDDNLTFNLRFETLDGAPGKSAGDFFLNEFCTDPLPGLQELEDGNETFIAMHGDHPPPETSFDLTFAVMMRNALSMYRISDGRHEWHNYLLHSPAKILVSDVFIRDDLYGETVPEVSLHIPAPSGPALTSRLGHRDKLNTLDLETPVMHIGNGLERVAVKEVPSYRDLVRHVFERAGWDPGRYRVHRIKVVYPVPLVFMNWRFALPEAPG